MRDRTMLFEKAGRYFMRCIGEAGDASDYQYSHDRKAWVPIDRKPNNCQPMSVKKAASLTWVIETSAYLNGRGSRSKKRCSKQWPGNQGVGNVIAMVRSATTHRFVSNAENE